MKSLYVFLVVGVVSATAELPLSHVPLLAGVIPGITVPAVSKLVQPAVDPNNVYAMLNQCINERPVSGPSSPSSSLKELEKLLSAK